MDHCALRRYVHTQDCTRFIAVVSVVCRILVNKQGIGCCILVICRGIIRVQTVGYFNANHYVPCGCKCKWRSTELMMWGRACSITSPISHRTLTYHWPYFAYSSQYLLETASEQFVGKQIQKQLKIKLNKNVERVAKFA